MPEGPDGKTIIVVKKVSGHGGHHGGAWKVAYADFVTAMMALFMVLWLVNSASVTTRERIASYFRRPGVFLSGSGTPLEMGGAGILPDTFAPTTAGNSSITPTRKIYDVQGLSQGKFREGFGHGEGTEAGDELKIAQLEKMARDIYRAIGAAGGAGGSAGAGAGASGKNSMMLPRDQTGDWNGEIKVRTPAGSGSGSGMGMGTHGKVLGGGDHEGKGLGAGQANQAGLGAGAGQGAGLGAGTKGPGAGEGEGHGPSPHDGKGETGKGGELTGGIAKGAGENVAGTGPAIDGELVGGQYGSAIPSDDEEPVEIKPSTGEGEVSPVGDVEIRVDKEGLHIEIMDTPTASMFLPGSAQMSPEAEKALQKVATIILGLSNVTLAIEGHTDATPYRGGPLAGYTNWELSADRANAARHVLQLAGVKDTQITSVSGLGSQKLKVPENPTAPANRRITISLQYTPEAEEALHDKISDKKEKKKNGQGEGEEIKLGEVDKDVISPEEVQNTIYDLEALGIDLTKPDWVFTDEQKLLYHLGMVDILPADEPADTTVEDITAEEINIEDVPLGDDFGDSSDAAEVMVEEVGADKSGASASSSGEVIEVQDVGGANDSSSSSGIPYNGEPSDGKHTDWNDKQQIFNNDTAFFGEK